MLKAAFRIHYPGSSVDETNGIVSGCRLAEVNKLAQFAGADGKLVELMVSPTLISDLLDLCEKQGRLDAYWTHDRLISEKKSDALHDSVGVWKNFRTDEAGNLVADIQLAPTEYRDRVLWAAKNDPQGIMTSMVFDYQGERDTARATQVSSGDFVRFGAATTALLSAYPTVDSLSDQASKTMDLAEFLAFLQTPEALEAVKAIVKSAEKSAAPEEPSAEVMAAAESEAGITAEDKKDEDKDKPAAMRLAIQASRAVLRKIESAKEETAILAEAKFTKNLGKGVYSAQITGGDQPTAQAKFDAAVKDLTSKGVPKHTAVLKVIDTNPELYRETQKALFAAPVQR